MGWIGNAVDYIKSLPIRQALTQVVTLGMIVTSALIIWKGLMFVSGTDSPVVVVLSGSMEPGFRRESSGPNGLFSFWFSFLAIIIMTRLTLNFWHPYARDVLFLQMSKNPIRTGEIVVFNVDGRKIPIVHRVIKVHERADSGEVDVLTKGDNNFEDDRDLYAPRQRWLQRHHIMGRAVGFLPYVGWVTIIMIENPFIKYLLIGALGLLVVTSKD